MLEVYGLLVVTIDEKNTKDGIKYVFDNSVELGIDNPQIVIIGDSAGGHLATVSGLPTNQVIDENYRTSQTY